MIHRVKRLAIISGVATSILFSGILWAGESIGQSKQFSGRKPKIVDFYVDELKIYKKEARPGEKIKYVFYIKNNGTGAAKAVVKVHFTKLLNNLSASNCIHSKTYTIKVRDRTGSSVLSHTLPLRHPTGKYFIKVVIDPENKVKEKNERNNKKFWPIMIHNRTLPVQASGPVIKTDVGIQNFRCSKSSVNDGDSINVRFQVKNLGSSHIKQVSFELFLGYLDVWARKAVLPLKAGNYHNIARGGQKSFNRSFIIPWNIDPTHIRHVAVVLDGGKKLDEKDRSNNAAALPLAVNVRGRADLTITHLDRQGPRLSREGAPFHVRYNIKNVGTRASLPSKCKITYSKLESRTTLTGGRPHITESWRVVDRKEFTIIALRPNQSMPGTLSFRIPGGARGLKVFMKVDIEDIMIEANERNNEKVTNWQ